MLILVLILVLEDEHEYEDEYEIGRSFAPMLYSPFDIGHALSQQLIDHYPITCTQQPVTRTVEAVLGHAS